MYGLQEFADINCCIAFFRRLTVGSACGSIRDLFAKVKAIDAKHGKFDLLLCTGDFFGAPKDEEQEYGDDEDVMQLLNGSLDGECNILRAW